MSEVTLQIEGRPYTVNCEDGQESHIEALGAMINDKLAGMGQLAPSRSQNLLFAALFLADDLQEAQANAAKVAPLEKKLAKRQDNLEKASNEDKDILLERDALLSERDTLRADHEAVKSELAEAKTQVELLRVQKAAPSATIMPSKLEKLANALEKCASELEDQLTDA